MSIIISRLYDTFYYNVCYHHNLYLFIFYYLCRHFGTFTLSGLLSCALTSALPESFRAGPTVPQFEEGGISLDS